jgi:hypothetical protein
VRLSRWAGALEITSSCYSDATPIFDDPDPYTVRFKVRPIAMFPIEEAIPIDAEGLWEGLSLTKHIKKRIAGWAQHANLRASLRQIDDADAELLMTAIRRQADVRKLYPLTPTERYRVGSKKLIRTTDRDVIVAVPDEIDEREKNDGDFAPEDARESHYMQATLAMIGANMGFRIWIPKADRERVKACLAGNIDEALLEKLPLNYDDTTLRTIQQIDVIWLQDRSMARAFEVEHTTAIYSGLLRMADLLALQPNMNIQLHIVAPTEKREKVLREIARPVFSLLGQGPLYESCTYLSYDAVKEISSIKHLSHMSDSILDEYQESAEED